jgi:hypothetical protein
LFLSLPLIVESGHDPVQARQFSRQQKEGAGKGGTDNQLD